MSVGKVTMFNNVNYFGQTIASPTVNYKGSDKRK